MFYSKEKERTHKEPGRIIQKDKFLEQIKFRHDNGEKGFLPMIYLTKGIFCEAGEELQPYDFYVPMFETRMTGGELTTDKVIGGKPISEIVFDNRDYLHYLLKHITKRKTGPIQVDIESTVASYDGKSWNVHGPFSIHFKCSTVSGALSTLNQHYKSDVGTELLLTSLDKIEGLYEERVYERMNILLSSVIVISMPDDSCKTKLFINIM